MRRAGRAAAVAAALLLAPLPAPSRAEETVDDVLCRLVETSAAAHRLPVRFLTRLIWRESSFRPGVVSHAGAEGVAQFMPGTARERGLADPFDPEQAIPAAAALLGDLRSRFGSLGLAAAAYNAGPGRTAGWLAGRSSLPPETQDYVRFVTGREAEDWRTDPDPAPAEPPLRAPPVPGLGPSAVAPGCLVLVAGIRTSAPESAVAEGPFAPWGVQLAGNFSKARALAAFERTRARHPDLLADLRPMVIGTRSASRGTRRFWRVRAPSADREQANALCAALRRQGGACVVFRSR